MIIHLQFLPSGFALERGPLREGAPGFSRAGESLARSPRSSRRVFETTWSETTCVPEARTEYSPRRQGATPLSEGGGLRRGALRRIRVRRADRAGPRTASRCFLPSCFNSPTPPLQESDFPCVILYEKGKTPRIFRNGNLFTPNFSITEFRESFLDAWYTFLKH